ncbi:DNA topoisomerase IV subunit A [Methylobacillus gramineus]|uniref:DNA topoisomerase IV subunit A n=1 Tax=Methylobacillus gramineus TaxID=755169 RepID=UPI001CFFF8E4|nr:DNA topoisomerase IV subunit A [Methylobacillus gramineus]MCB5185302.1 DNA topoisomerase IV subunit A [Methylobacillus gramineus]
MSNRSRAIPKEVNLELDLSVTDTDVAPEIPAEADARPASIDLIYASPDQAEIIEPPQADASKETESIAEREQENLADTLDMLPGEGGGNDDDGGSFFGGGFPPVEDNDIDKFAELAYLSYSVSVTKGRSIPSVSDGQKPVQRRVLFSMKEIGLDDGVRLFKSARVVGDVLGKYHPHGDSSVYDASVRVAQKFSLRYPLVDGQGNFGSRDGDNAAAMRYTEMRLSPISRLLLSEINRGTVDFKPTYDGSFNEPVVLPARLPFILLNGATGTAVALATNIPSHNLVELAKASILAVQGKLTLDKFLEHVPGPDFANKCQLTNTPAELREIYGTGRGSFRLRGIWRREEQARGQYRIIIEALPHGVSASDIMSAIEELCNPKPKEKDKNGKLILSKEQQLLKNSLLDMLETSRDESTSKDGIRIILEPRTGKIDADALMNFLLVHTSLETTFSNNHVVVGLDGNPRPKTVVEMLNEWATFRFNTVTRRTQFDLNKAEARLHILYGRRMILLNIDEVIRIVREAEDPKADLMAAFGLTDIQAEDILEIKLRQLAKLEAIKIQAEIDTLEPKVADWKHLLANESAMRDLIIKEIKQDAKEHADERRTVIQPVSKASLSIEETIIDEPITIVVSKLGWVRTRNGHNIDLATINWRPGDDLMTIIEARTTSQLIVLDTMGRSYSVHASNLPGGKGDGVPITSLVDLQSGSRMAFVMSGNDTDHYLFSSSGGYGFLAPLSSLMARNKAGKVFMKLDEGEKIMEPLLLGADPANAEQLLFIQTSQKLLGFAVKEVKVLANGGKGVQLINLSEGDKVKHAHLEIQPDSYTYKPEKGKKVTLDAQALTKVITSRAKKGISI